MYLDAEIIIHYASRCKKFIWSEYDSKFFTVQFKWLFDTEIDNSDKQGVYEENCNGYILIYPLKIKQQEKRIDYIIF